MNDALITMTDAAIAHIKKMMSQNDKAIGFRISIKKTGCSGYAYVPDIIESIVQEDTAIRCQDLPVYVDSAYLELLRGVMIDYISDNTAGLKQKRLVFINPNERNRCGCGESFTIE